MAWSAVHKYAQISPRKTRLIVDMIRGMHVGQAIDILRYTHQRSASMVEKVLKSAVANADDKEADIERLVITEARVDMGPVLKRIRPKDRGRAFMIRKPTSHIRIVVEEK